MTPGCSPAGRCYPTSTRREVRGRRALHACEGLLGFPSIPSMRGAAPQLHLRHDETERRPTTGGHGTLEPGPCFGYVTVHQIPVGNAVAQRRHLDVAGVGGRENRIGGNLAAIEAQPLRIGVARIWYVGMAVEQRLRFGFAART